MSTPHPIDKLKDARSFSEAMNAYIAGLRHERRAECISQAPSREAIKEWDNYIQQAECARALYEITIKHAECEVLREFKEMGTRREVIEALSLHDWSKLEF